MVMVIIDRIDPLPHSRAEVKYECHLPPEYGEDQFGRHHPTISSALASREQFPLAFVPAGEVEADLASFLVGTGEEQLLTLSRQRGLSLRDLAVLIRDNHRNELANLQRGGRPLRTEKNRDWSSDQRAFYIHLLKLECRALESILDRHSGSPQQSTA